MEAMIAIYNELQQGAEGLKDLDFEFAAKSGWFGNHPELAASLCLLAGNKKTQHGAIDICSKGCPFSELDEGQ